MTTPTPAPQPKPEPIRKFVPESPEQFRERLARRRAELNRITRNDTPERPRAGPDQE